MSTDWLMVIITFVYVIATIIICVFNGKSANAAKQQLEFSQEQQAQNNRIQLLEKRIELISFLDSEISKLPNWKTDISNRIYSPVFKNEIMAYFDDDFYKFYTKLIDDIETINMLIGDYEHAEKRGDCRGKTPPDILKEIDKLNSSVNKNYEKEKNRIYSNFFKI